MTRLLASLIVVVVLLMPSLSWAAVAVDNSFAHVASSAQTSPFSVTSSSGNVKAGSVAANSNRVLIASCAGIWSGDPGTVSMTWNGSSMTPITSVQAGDFGNRQVHIFGIIAPASGANTLSCSWTGAALSGAIDMGAVSFYNADQSTGWSNATSSFGNPSTTASITITTASGDAAVMSEINSGTPSMTITSGTEAFQSINDGGTATAYVLADASSEVISYTLGSSVHWGMAGVRVLQSTGGGAETFGFRKRLPQ